MPLKIELTDEQVENFIASHEFIEELFLLVNDQEDGAQWSGYHAVASVILMEVKQKEQTDPETPSTTVVEKLNWYLSMKKKISNLLSVKHLSRSLKDWQRNRSDLSVAIESLILPIVIYFIGMGVIFYFRSLNESLIQPLSFIKSCADWSPCIGVIFSATFIFRYSKLLSLPIQRLNQANSYAHRQLIESLDLSQEKLSLEQKDQISN